MLRRRQGSWSTTCTSGQVREVVVGASESDSDGRESEADGSKRRRLVDLEAAVLGDGASRRHADDAWPKPDVAVAHSNERRAKWTDADDDADGGRRAAQFERAFGSAPGGPHWAARGAQRPRRRRRRSSASSQSDSDELDDAEDVLQRRSGPALAASAALPGQLVDFKRLRDVTFGHRLKNPIQALEFHKSAPMLLTTGVKKAIYLFEVDGEENELLHKVHLEEFRVSTARFSADGCRVLIGSGRQSYFYSYDMASDKAVQIPPVKGLNRTPMGSFVESADGETLAFRGKFGLIHLLSAKTFEWMGDLKANGDVAALAFAREDPRRLLSLGDDGLVHVWHVGEQSCVHRFADEGSVRGRSLALSHDGRFVACGSNTGVVNVYEASTALQTASPRPLKSLMNLTTSADCVRFNPTSELLATASSEKDNAIKLFHLRSLSTFSNFPLRQAALQNVMSVDFSSTGAYMAVGNERSQILLFRLQHYDL